MRILSLSSVYPNPGEPGLGLFVRSRLQALAKHAEVKVVAPIPVLDYSHPQRRVFRPREFPICRQDGAIEVFHPRWIFPPYGTPLNVFCEIGRLLPLFARIRREYPFDLIDAHFGYPEGCAAALAASFFRVPFTITLRGSETMFDNYRYRRAAMKTALRRTAAAIAVSDELRAFAISRGAHPQRAHTIPNGIDTNVFHLYDPAAMRQRHDLPATRKLVLTAGELIEAKGHHLVVDALKSLIARGVDAELLIVGATARGGPQFEQTLRNRVRDAGMVDRVRFLGWVDRNTMSELLSAVDLFCLASYTEGWPNVVNEALACGAPVVVTQVGGVAAMVPSAQYGTIVPQRDIAALERAILSGLDRTWDRTAISEWGRSRSWDTVAREVLGTYAQAIKACPDAGKSLSNTIAGNI
jgi:glycosyltransferase involved in cell wall biosynthesis